MAPERVQRKLTTILAADVEGFSRLMRADEEATLKTLGEYREIIDALIARHEGRIFSTGGDSVLAEFGSAVEAVRCAISCQEEIASRNAELADDRKLMFRIGINVGDVMVRGDDLFGDGVNVAARLEGLAQAGGVCVSSSVFEQVKHKLSLGFEDLGPQEVKNIAEPVSAYRLVPGSVAVAAKAPSYPARRRGVAGATAAALLVMVAAVMWWRPWAPAVAPESGNFCERKTALAVPSKPSIAILPFNNLSGDPKQDTFSDGLTEDIITSLAKLSDLFVIARNSSFTYKGKAVKVQKVAKDLGVRYILEGSVQKVGERLRINAQLIDASTGMHLWAERYDRETKDIFTVRDEIIKKILTALQVKLTTGEQSRIWSRQTGNLEAYQLVLQGIKEFQRFNKESNARARALARRAIQLDANFTGAWNLLAWTHVSEADYGGDRSESIRLGAKYAKKAFELDDTNPDGFALLGFVAMKRGDLGKAVELGRKAVALGPNSGDVHGLLGLYLNAAGRPEEAIPMIKKAMRLSPYYPTFYLSQLGGAYLLLGRYEEAITAFRKLICRSPNNMYVRLKLALSYGSLGRHEEARKTVAELRRIQPDFSLASFRKINKTTPFGRKPADLKRHLDILRKAGVPEK